MWYVITKLVANCKDDVYLIKMVNFKVVVLFIKILTCFVSQRTFGFEVFPQLYGRLFSSFNLDFLVNERYWKLLPQINKEYLRIF